MAYFHICFHFLSHPCWILLFSWMGSPCQEWRVSRWAGEKEQLSNIGYILAKFWLQSYFILSTLCLHSENNLATFLLHSDCILTTFWLHSDYIQGSAGIPIPSHSQEWRPLYPIPELWDWIFFNPFPFPNFGNGLFTFPSRSWIDHFIVGNQKGKWKIERDAIIPTFSASSTFHTT